jgi:hypothetical protein
MEVEVTVGEVHIPIILSTVRVLLPSDFDPAHSEVHFAALQEPVPVSADGRATAAMEVRFAQKGDRFAYSVSKR